MPKFLFTVVETYESGAFLVVLGDLPESRADCRHGDLLELRRPDGTVLQSLSAGVSYDPPAERALSVAFKGMSKADVPVGSEVWLVNSERSPRKPSRHYQIRETLDGA